jgi:glutaredoxin
VKQLTLYTRVRCHLCDVVKETLERVQAVEPFALEIFDIDQDPALRALYDWEVPVVMIDGKKWAKYRVDESALLKRLRSEA